MVWDYSLRDLQTITRLKAQAEIARANQTYESLGLIAAQIFGGGEKKEVSTDPPQTVEELQERLKELL